MLFPTRVPVHCRFARRSDTWECSWSLSQVTNLDIIPMARSHYITQCH